jgi:uncharacterized delta-60 repeat protein
LTEFHIERLEPRLQFSGGIKYGVAASGDPAKTGVLSATGPGLKDLGAQGVRLFTDVSFLSSDFDVTPSGKIYVRNPSLVTSLSYAKKYHAAGIDVTLCISLSIDRSMIDGSLLTDSTGASRGLRPSELRSPKVFRTWYDTLSKAQISKTDTTSVTKVLDFWEIGNEPNHGKEEYWSVDSTQPDGGIEEEMNSYVDHDLIPAYDVLHAIGEPVIGAGLASGTLAQFDELNNQPGARHHQYSDHADYLNFHPYGYLNSVDPTLTPQAEVQNFTSAMYDDGTVTKPFVITEYNISDFGHIYPLDPNANPTDTAAQLDTASDLDAVHTALLKAPHVKQECAWIYYYRLIATDGRTRGALFYPPPDGTSAYTPMPVIYDMFKQWARGMTPPAPKIGGGIVNLGAKPVSNAVATQKDGKTLVLSDDGVRRYDSQGNLDTSYGINGFAKLPMIGKALALQGDGNLVVAGNANDAAATPLPYHLVVMRLSTKGTIDKGFGSEGVFALADGSGSDAQSIALRAGKIVVAGARNGTRDGIVIRLDLSGALDPTFGDGGAADVKKRGRFSDVSVAKTGAVTVLLSPYSLSPQTSVVRYTRAGALDAKFSKDGISDAQPIIGDGMFVEGTGSVTLVGHAPLAQRQVLAHYTARGNVDISFGVSGVQTLSGKKFIRGTPIELPDGSRYLYGSIGSSLASDAKRIFISKLSPAGQFDRGFGAGGVMTLASPNVQDLPLAAAINSDGKLTLAASTFTQDDGGGITQELFLTVDLI